MKIHEQYLHRLIVASEKLELKIVTGVSGCGMESLLSDFRDYLLALDDSTNIVEIHLDKESIEALGPQFKEGVKNVVFLYDCAMRKPIGNDLSDLLSGKKWDMYLIRENEFAQDDYLFPCDHIEILPPSFAEYYGEEGDIDDCFDAYLSTTSMAGKEAAEILEKDIIGRILETYRIEGEDCLRKLIKLLLANPKDTPSIRSLARDLGEDGRPKNDKTVGSYLNSLCKSRLFYTVPVYDDFRKKALGSAIEYVVSSPALANAATESQISQEALYPSLVALELKRRGYEVYKGKIYDKNVDFLANKNGERAYIQIASDTSYSALRRIMRPFFTFHDAYPKLVLARTKEPMQKVSGVEVWDIARWLNHK